MQTPSYASREEMAQLAASMLLEIDAVHFRADQPYTLTSGLASPVYIDCRKLISYPRIRSTLMDFAVATLHRNIGYEAFDAIAGGETAGIPFAHGSQIDLSCPCNMCAKNPKVLAVMLR
jgi:orotate phosphoribosyltransferase